MGIVKKYKTLVIVIGLLLAITSVKASNRFSVANGNWNSTATWSATSGGGGGASVPVAGDLVTIEGGHNVTITVNAACASISFTTNTATSLTFNPGITLTVSGAITIPRSGSGINTISVGAGILNTASIAFTSGGGTVRHSVTISTGSVIVTGNVTQTSSTGSASIIFTGAGYLKLGGTFLTSATGTLTTYLGCTVEYSQIGAQSVGDFDYQNLTLSGSGAKSIVGGTTIASDLSISGATANITNGLNINANSLTLDGIVKNQGTWGSTSSSAANKTNTYFNTTTGLVTLPAIIPPASITAGGGGLSCPGSNVTLTSSGSNISNQYWEGPNNFYSLSANPVLNNFTPAMAGTYTVTGSSLSGINLIANGNFESGAVGFTSSYTKSTDLQPEGRYAVVTNPNSVHSAYVNCGDHTSGSGYQMVVNGATVPDASIWAQTVNVAKNTDYQYSYWVQSVVGYNPSQTQLYINGTLVGPVYTALTGTCQWLLFIYNWNSGSNNTAYLNLVNQNITQGGNDFSVDDIIFQRVSASVSTVTVSVNPTVGATTFTLGTTSTRCQGTGTTTYTATATNTTGITYSLDASSIAGGNTIVAGTGVVTYAAGWSGTSIITATASGCGGPTTATHTVTIYSNLIAAISGGATPISYNSSPGTLTATGSGGSGTYSYLWYKNGTSTGVTTQTYAPGNLIATTTFYCAITSLCGTVNTPTTTIVVSTTLTWNGSLSTVWTTVGNWTPNGLPSPVFNIIIPDALTTPNSPTLSTFSEIKSLTINVGGRLSIGYNGSLTVDLDLINNGGIAGMVIKSTSDGTGTLLHNTDFIPATVQRYFGGATEDWHLISSPVSGQSISGSWLPSGTYGNGTGYDLYVWNEPSSCWIYKLNTTAAINWNTVHPGSNFMVGRGYLYALQSPNTTKEFTGNLNNGLINYNLTFSSTDVSLKGFNLVGNPYPSAIDWQAASGWARSNLVNSGGGYDMWIWNPTANNYGVFNSATGSGTNAVTRYISSMQGFFVQAASSGILSMNNNVRLHEVVMNGFKNAQTDADMISLIVQSEEDQSFDEARLLFGYNADQTGSRKLFSSIVSAPSLYIPSSGEYYSVKYLTDTVHNPSVPVMFKPGSSGNYSLSCNFDLTKFGAVILEDRLTHNTHNLKAEKTYNFTANKNDDPNRFVLYFTSTRNYITKGLPARIYSEGNRLVVDLTQIRKGTDICVYDLLGRVLLKKKLQGEIQHYLTINPHKELMIVLLRNQDGILCKKILW